jgi:hypothetical protein
MLAPASAFAQDEGAYEPAPVAAVPVQPLVQPPPAVFAPAIPLDSVYTRDGGIVRGRVQEILPGSHVTVALDIGGVRVVPWPNVERVIVASAATIPPLPAEPPHEAAPLPAPPPVVSGPLVHVHLSTPKATLFRKPAGTTQDFLVCVGPCDADVPVGDEYQVSVGHQRSKKFRLRGAPGSTVVLDADGPSVPGIALGATLTGGGWLTAYVASLAAVALCTNGQQCPSGVGIAMAGGAVAGVTGIVMILMSVSTDVTQHTQSAGPPQDARFVREPVWRTPSTFETAASGGAMTVPLFTKTF